MRTITRGNARFQVADGDPYWDTLQAGTWEPYTVALLDRLVKPGMRFFDIGAWRGPVSLIAASKGAEVHSFEPDPVAFAGLKANTEANDGDLRSRMTINNLAVTPDGAPIRLFTRFDFGDSGSSMLSRVKDAGRSVEVASSTFDAYIEGKGIDRIDMIKMDIEGGEFFVLPTMRAALERFRPVLYVATHWIYLIEYFEKKDTPSGIMRRLRRSVRGAMGLDPFPRSRAKAEALRISFKQVLAFYPFVYTRDLKPVDAAGMDAVIDTFGELIFSPRDLLA